jgi:O-antigen ligase
MRTKLFTAKRHAQGSARRSRIASGRISSSTSFWTSLPTAAFAFFALCTFLGGGTARTDASSLLYLRPLAIIAVALYIYSIRLADLRPIKIPLALLSIFAVIMMLSLVPIPSEYWINLPGRATFLPYSETPASWRSISISPDRTLNSTVSLLIPLAALMAACYFSDIKKSVLAAFIIGGLFSGALALVQLSLGDASSLYLYRGNIDGAVGVFSNPNHQAVLLACLMPMIAVWLADSAKGSLPRDLTAVSLLCLILVLIMVTGSRSGLAIAFVALLCTFALHDAFAPRVRHSMRRRYRIFYFVAMFGAVGIAAVTVALGRNLAAARFDQLSFASDLRIANFPLFLELAKDYFPIGSGAGTFDPAFRMIEPADIIKKSYVNHAHNEAIEIIITLGLPGLLMIGGFTAWFFASLASILRDPFRGRNGYPMLGATLIAIIMLASLTDYSLRTPLMGAIFAVACAWLSMGSVAARDARQAKGLAPDRPQTLIKLQDELDI